jgi:glycogen(starch) synthase
VGKVKAFTQEFEPDVVHINIPGMAAAFSSHVMEPAQVNVAAFHCALDGWPGMWPLARANAEHAGAMIVPSRFLARNIATVLRRPADEFHVIEHGVPENRLLSVSPLGDPPPARFLFAGRLVPLKAPNVATAAIDNLGKRGVRAELVIAGEGPMKPALSKAAEHPRLAGRVFLLGELSQDKLAEQFRDVAALIAPSVSKEAFSLISAEAALAGRPVLASRRGALAETVIDGETGLLFEPGDVNGLADLMQRLLVEPGLAVGLGAAARARALTRYRLSSMVDRYEALYREVAKGTRRLPHAQA